MENYANGLEFLNFFKFITPSTIYFVHALSHLIVLKFQIIYDPVFSSSRNLTLNPLIKFGMGLSVFFLLLRLWYFRLLMEREDI